MTEMTRETYDRLRQELSRLIDKRKQLISIKEIAHREGDTSDNTAYHESMRNLSVLETRIADMQEAIEHARIYGVPAFSGKVVIGSTVTISDVSNNVEEEYTIVGPKESNPSMGLISINSPIGSSLMRHKIGDIVSVKTPDGQVKFKITNIE